EDDLEHLGEEGLPDVAPLDDGGGAGTGEEDGLDVRLEMLANEFLARVAFSEARHQVDVTAEPREVIRAREGAAGEGLLADVSGGDDRLLRRLPQDRKSTRLNSSHVAISYAV